ncbi:protein AGENET DOMAIN (AGD)-CONTAINING P1-like [Malania oleifera]|uniref:protein AGENET DOMAIN (AGD)-CONTAINING P1-like n=1 Tax=Malania oleifera TaxID=397392 RepID=UPI0025ADF1A2|nr:protein AGENET DOMAIN (AGD)-CONTAINING P1-like [Malania oleifera]
MSFRYKEAVEICSKQEVSYYAANILAAVGKTRFLVQYKTRYAVDTSKTRLLIEMVEANDIRPVPPEIPDSDFSVADRVDAYLDNAWRVGKVSRKVDPNYYVRLDSTGDEFHCPFYRVRPHFDWEHGKWVRRRSGPQNAETQGAMGGGDKS